MEIWNDDWQTLRMAIWAVTVYAEPTRNPNKANAEMTASFRKFVVDGIDAASRVHGRLADDCALLLKRLKRETERLLLLRHDRERQAFVQWKLWMTGLGGNGSAEAYDESNRLLDELELLRARSRASSATNNETGGAARAQPKRRSGGGRRAEYDPADDTKLAAAWDQFRESGGAKADFAEYKGMTVEEINRASIAIESVRNNSLAEFFRGHLRKISRRFRPCF